MGSYRSRVSGPLLDRIDIHLEGPRWSIPTWSRATPKSRARSSASGSSGRGSSNAGAFGTGPESTRTPTMTTRDLRHHFALTPGVEQLLRNAVNRFGLSARGYHRILKIARTIADLAGADELASTAHPGLVARRVANDADVIDLRSRGTSRERRSSHRTSRGRYRLVAGPRNWR